MTKSDKTTKTKRASADSKSMLPTTKSDLLPRWGEDFERIADLVDRIRVDLWRRPFPEISHPLKRLRAGGLPLLTIPVVDLFEEKDNVVVKAELPGLEKNDVEVSLTDSRLTIKGEKKKEEKVNEKDYSYSERSYGAFARVFALPCQVKADKVKASFKNGVLEVNLPKSEEAKKQAVSVKIT